MRLSIKRFKSIPPFILLSTLLLLVLRLENPLLEKFEKKPAKSLAAKPTLVQNARSEYTVKSCNDGDTCKIIGPSGVQFKVRLIGIDAPEFTYLRNRRKKPQSAQPFALESKEALNQWVQGKSVELKTYGTDMFGRNLAEIYFNKENINLKMVQQGYAEISPASQKNFNNQIYENAQTLAQKLKKGIWGIDSYQSPADFRKKNRRK